MSRIRRAKSARSGRAERALRRRAGCTAGVATQRSVVETQHEQPPPTAGVGGLPPATADTPSTHEVRNYPASRAKKRPEAERRVKEAKPTKSVSTGGQGLPAGP